jgi:cytochrome b
MWFRVPDTTTYTRVRVWDLFVRFFHWSLVLALLADAFLINGATALHHVIGYYALALVFARIVWGFAGSRYARFRTFPPSLSASFDQLLDIAVDRRIIHVGHTPLGALMIYNLLLTVIVIGTSGYLMTTDAFWGAEWPEVLHKASIIWAEICAAIHIIAVIYESHRTKVNLPRAMITGYKDLP